MIVLALVPSLCKAMVFDNRFIPLFQWRRLVIEGLPSVIEMDAMFATASSASGPQEDEIGIPEIFGTLDQGKLSNALDIVGKPNPLRTDWRGAKIPWAMTGKLQAQGAEFFYHQAITQHLSVGASWLFMRSNTSQEFILKDDRSTMDHVSLLLGPSDKQELNDELREMFRVIGIKSNTAHQTGFGDIDAYIRGGGTWDFTLRCRRIDAGARVGVLMGSGVLRDINNPASIPYGGNGHWGMYGALDALFEVKEDIKVGCLLRLNKRFAKTSKQRISVAGEPFIFGAAVGDVNVNPGVTFICSPWFMLENLREGLGAGVFYTLTIHQQDEWNNVRPCPPVPVCITETERVSGWSSSYFTVLVLYDFGRMRVVRDFAPVVSLRWDIPSMFKAKFVPNTHKVALGISFNF